MKGWSKYDVISVAYKWRLLFRTDAEYRDALGVSFETVVNKRDSERDMDMYYDTLNRRAALIADESLTEIVADYILASDLYLSVDWGDRTQMASRKKFCRMLFRIYATAGRSLSSDEIFKFKIKDDDKRLMKAFFPEGLDKRPAVDIGFVVLMAFGILRPCTEPSRGRDVSDKETLESLKKLRSLIEVLKEDTPRLGSTEKPLVFDEFLNVLDSRLNEVTDLAECTPLWLSYALRIIARACRTTVITEELSAESLRLQGLDMPGIWIDDTDHGDSRFWIFPDNMLMAFCFRRDGMAWTMTPYEFKVRFYDDADYMDYFILIDAHANVDYLLSSDHVIDIGQVTSGSIEYKVNVVTGELKRVMLSKWMLPFPGWFDWREWQRLKPDDPRYREFHAVLKAVYDPGSPYSVFFRNVAPVLTDLTNNLVGRDNKYLYVYDRRPKRFRIWERSRDRFTYESDSGEDFSALSLFELEISEKYPLYAVPVTVKRKTHGNPDLEKLINILSDAENINEAYILHSERSPYPRLVLPAYGASVALNMDELKDLGVKKFTSRP